MRFTRAKRIALEVLGPPAVGAGLWMAGLLVDQLVEHPVRDYGRVMVEAMAVSLYALFVSYMVAGIQSIFYAIVMEWNFSAGLDPASWRAVGLSSLLGVLSGVVIPVAWSSQGPPDWKMGLLFGGTGLAAGFLLGLYVRRRTRLEEADTS